MAEMTIEQQRAVALCLAHEVGDTIGQLALTPRRVSGVRQIGEVEEFFRHQFS